MSKRRLLQCGIHVRVIRDLIKCDRMCPGSSELILVWRFRSPLTRRRESFRGLLNQSHTRIVTFQYPFESEVRSRKCCKFRRTSDSGYWAVKEPSSRRHGPPLKNPRAATSLLRKELLKGRPVSSSFSKAGCPRIARHIGQPAIFAAPRRHRGSVIGRFPFSQREAT